MVLLDKPRYKIAEQTFQPDTKKSQTSLIRATPSNYRESPMEVSVGVPYWIYKSEAGVLASFLCAEEQEAMLIMPSKASSSVTTAKPTQLTPQEVPIVFQRYRTELQNLAQKIGELESEMEEHA